MDHTLKEILGGADYAALADESIIIKLAQMLELYQSIGLVQGTHA